MIDFKVFFNSHERIAHLQRLATHLLIVVGLLIEITGSRKAERDAQSDPNDLIRIMPAEGCAA